MPRKILNVGSAPGNNGDGDSLRDAFIKTQQNFEELYTYDYVNDTSITDHSDPLVPGSIAYAVEQSEINGGTPISIGPGTYNCSNKISLKSNIKITGSGHGVTTINFLNLTNGFEIGAGAYGIHIDGTLSHMTIKLPIDSANVSVNMLTRQGSGFRISDINFEGGGALSWAIKVASANQLSISNIVCRGYGSGIQWNNDANWNANYGDSIISNVDIGLKNPGTTGIEFRGNTRGVINNILLNRVEVRGDRVHPQTVGIKLSRTSRITLTNTDVENIEKAIINGPNSISCAFINTFAIGCSTDYVPISPSTQTTIIGGYGYFAESQELPTTSVYLFDSSLSKRTKIKSGVREIEHFNDSITPRHLDIEDSGSTLFTNKGATDSVTFILPNAPFAKSLEYQFSVIENTPLVITNIDNIERIRAYDGTSNHTDSNGFIFSSKPGSTISLHNIDNVWWIVDKYTGTWEKGI